MWRTETCNHSTSISTASVNLYNRVVSVHLIPGSRDSEEQPEEWNNISVLLSKRHSVRPVGLGFLNENRSIRMEGRKDDDDGLDRKVSGDLCKQRRKECIWN